jgi:2-hydroxy-6-oxonona-2,4-dienedioate hydrolase
VQKASVMSVMDATLAIPSLAAAGTGAWIYRHYRRDLRARLARLKGASLIAQTRCGPIEYAEEGSGASVLIVHGAGGGFDQGMEFGGASLARRGFYVVSSSRFGYLRTPMPNDASPAAQADAYAALLDALGIAHSAILGVSAGAPSAIQFAIRHPHRCSALVLLVPLAFKPGDIVPTAPKLSAFAAKFLMTIVRSNWRFWIATRLARDLLIKLVLATPPAIVYSASRDERARAARILDGIMPIRRRVAGIVNDGRVSSSLQPCELERIKAPTLVLSVRDDLNGSFASAQYTASQLPHAKFVTYETGGHIWVGHDNEVLAEIVSFLTP